MHDPAPASTSGGVAGRSWLVSGPTCFYCTPLLALSILMLLAQWYAMRGASVAFLSGKSGTNPPPRDDAVTPLVRANSVARESSCPPVTDATKELLDGYYSVHQKYEWVPFSPLLRSVRDNATVEPFDILMLSDSLDRNTIQFACQVWLPGRVWIEPQNNKFPGFGEGHAVCKSDWGTITWLLIAGANPKGPYYYVGDEPLFYTPSRIESALVWYKDAHGHLPEVLIYQSNLWDIAMFDPDYIKHISQSHGNFISYMQSFTYEDPSVATRWLDNYKRSTEANIALIQRLAPAPATMLLMHTTPQCCHRLESAINMAIRKIAAKRCIPMIDWDELARIHMLDDQKWAQFQKGWYGDVVHPSQEPLVSWGMILLRFVRFFYGTLRRDPVSGDLVDWTRPTSGAPFPEWDAPA